MILRVTLLALLAGCGSKKPPVATAEPAPPAPEPVTTVERIPANEAPGPVAPEPPRAPAHERVNEAATLLMSDVPARVQQAMGILEEVVRDEPGTALAHFNLGVSRYKAGDREAARRSWQTAVNLDPKVGQAWLYLGQLQEDAGRSDMALSNYRTGLRNDPENMDLHVAVVGALRQQGRVDEAIEEAKKALKINAHAFLVYNNMGLAYLDRDELALAKFVYQKALTIDGASDNVYIQSNYGWTLWRTGEVGPATFHLKRAVELDPDFVPGLVYLSHIYMEDRNYADAIDLLERAARQDPENHGVQMNLGVAYRGVGRLEESARAYNKALAIDPGNPDPYYNLGVLKGDYLNPKDYDGAVSSFESYLNAGGTDRETVVAYIEEVNKEKRRAEKRSKAEEARKKREAERAARKKLLEEDAKRRDSEAPKNVWGGDTPPAEPPPADAPPPDDPPPETPPPKEEEPPPPADDSPWGGKAPEKPPEKQPEGDSPW